MDLGFETEYPVLCCSFSSVHTGIKILICVQIHKTALQLLFSVQSMAPRAEGRKKKAYLWYLLQTCISLGFSQPFTLGNVRERERELTHLKQIILCSKIQGNKSLHHNLSSALLRSQDNTVVEASSALRSNRRKVNPQPSQPSFS